MFYVYSWTVNMKANNNIRLDEDRTVNIWCLLLDDNVDVLIWLNDNIVI
jgi:hypothetical protein